MNSQGFRHTLLRRTRIPIPPPRQFFLEYVIKEICRGGGNVFHSKWDIMEEVIAATSANFRTRLLV